MFAQQTGASADAGRDTRPPRELVPRPEEHARAEAERLRSAVAALERVRTQLARTQRTLDAFVAQITGTPDGAHMRSAVTPAPEPLPEPTPEPVKAPVSTDPSRFQPPDVLAGHVLPPAELQPPPLPAVPRAPIAPTVPAAPPVSPAGADRPAPPGAITDHLRAPGERPVAPVGPVGAEQPGSGAPAAETPAPTAEAAPSSPPPAADGRA
jgi:hypothetical protein